MESAAFFGAIAAAGHAQGGQPPDLPFLGQYYGNGTFGSSSAANNRLRESSDLANSFFFYGERTGVIDQIRMHWRTYVPGGYANGDGGIYTIEIRPASTLTKQAVPLSSPICSISGVQPGVDEDNTWRNLTHTFTTQGEVTAGQPYCIVWRNTHANPNGNFVSRNIGLHTSFNLDADYEEPSGTDPGSVGASATPVSGWSPVKINGTVWYPWPAGFADDGGGSIPSRRIGPLYAMLRYDNGQWVGWGSFGGASSYKVPFSGDTMLRDRFRVSRANRIVSGVFIRATRRSAATGNLIVTLESGPASDTSGNGTQIEQVTVAASNLYDIGGGEDLADEGVSGSPNIDHVHYVWVPFSQDRTLTLGQLYNIRFHKSGGSGDFDVWPSQRSTSFMGLSPSPTSLTWDQWEAQRVIEWSNQEDSRGSMYSTNGGSSWSFSLPGGSPRVLPYIFKCVA